MPEWCEPKSSRTLSAKTVGNHITHIFAKTGVGSRAQAIVRAREVGFGQARSLH